ncbi:MAG: Crp/Fnr family transcriptional regulator [Hyphomicrobiaceae bacterium]
MALDTITERLAALEVFRGLSEERLERIAREADRIIFRDGQTLVAAGSEVDGALVIVAGQAVAMPDADRGLAACLVETGSMLGEGAMLTEHTCGITVVAEGEVRAIKIVRATLLAHLCADPGLAAHFHDRLAARLQRVALELRLIDERLAASVAPMPAAARVPA